MITALPERLLMDVVKKGFLALKNNPKLLVALFQNLTEPEFRELSDFITKTPINFALSYPRASQTLPAIHIILRGERETTTFLGDFMSTGYAPVEHSYAALGSAATPSTLQGLSTKVVGNLPVQSVANNRLYLNADDASAIFSQGYSPQNMRAYVIAGLGKGRSYAIQSFELDYIQLASSPVAVADSTSVIDIREGARGLAVGEPQLVYPEDTHVSQYGALFEASYSIDILTGHQDQTSYLYCIVKAIFYSARQYLEAQGLHNATLQGEDLAFRSDFTPSEAFHKALRVSFSYPFAVVHEEDTFRQFTIELCESLL